MTITVSGSPGVGVAIAVDIVHAVTAARVNNANFTAGGVGLEAVSSGQCRKPAGHVREVRPL